MQRLLFKYLLPLCMATGFAIAGRAQTAWSFSLPSLRGADSISLGAFAGKRILIVNSSLSADSIARMLALDRQAISAQKDKLVVILCPVAHADANQAKLKDNASSLFRQFEGMGMLVAAPVHIRGQQAHPLFTWLTTKSLNGVMDVKLTSEYCRFLINEQGMPAGYFTSQLQAGNDAVNRAIKTNQ